MNLTTDEAAKVIEALEAISNHAAQFPGRPRQYAIVKVKDALAILQAAKDRPQGLDRDEAKELIRNMRERCQNGQCDAALKDRPQPALDARAWLLSRGMWPEQLSSRVNLGDTAQAPTLLELFSEFAAAKSAAPVDAPKVLTDEEVKRIAAVVVPPDTTDEGRPGWTGYRSLCRDAAMDALRYARDNGYFASVNPPKVSQDEYDRMSFVMRGGVTPIPAKVDVEKIMEVVLDWCCPTRDAEDQLRDRLTKLLSA
jgi:hypothetical protein